MTSLYPTKPPTETKMRLPYPTVRPRRPKSATEQLSNFTADHLPHIERSSPTYREIITHISRGHLPTDGRSSPAHRETITHKTRIY